MSLYEYERNEQARELIRVQRESENPKVPTRAAEILGRLDEHGDRQDIITALVRAVERDDSGAVIAAAIDGVDYLGQDALEQLIAGMADADIEDGREQNCQCVAGCKDESLLAW